MKHNGPRKGTGVGPRLSTGGYVMIMVDNKEHYQHRFIMEQYLERKLERGEVVHHCNKSRQDNSLDNLELMLAGEHTKHHLTPERLRMMNLKSLKTRWNHEPAI